MAATSDPKEVLAMIKKATAKPLNFAVALGSTPDKHVVGVDRTMKPAKIFAEVRKEAKTTKGTFGTVSFAGGLATFACKDAATAVDKGLDQYFKKNKLVLKVAVTEAGASDDDEDEADEAAAEEAKKAEDAEAAKAAADEKAAEEAAEAEAEAAEADGEDEEPYEGAIDKPGMKRFIQMAMRMPIPFAFGIGGDDPVLSLARRGRARRLLDKMKGAGAAKKGAWGTMTVDAKVLVFTCESRVLPQMAKRIRLYLRGIGLTVKVRVLGEEPTEAEQQEANEELAAELRTLAEAGQALLPRLQEIAAASADMKATIGTAYKAFQEAGKARDIEELEIQLGHLRALAAGGVPDADLEDAEFEEETAEAEAETEDLAADDPDDGLPHPAGDPDASAALFAEFEKILPKLREAAEKVPSRAPDIELMMNIFEGSLAAGDLVDARELLGELKVLTIVPPNVQDEMAAAGKLTVAFQKAQLQWRAAVSSARSGLVRVRDAIATDPDIADVLDEVEPQLTIFDGVVAKLDDRLDETITAAMNARDPATKDDLTKRIAALVTEFRQLLDGDAVLSSIDDNPFAAVTIRSDLTQALAEIERALG